MEDAALPMGNGSTNEAVEPGRYYESQIGHQTEGDPTKQGVASHRTSV
jgi:hypothetical protein